MCHYLGEHPSIFVPVAKEPCYFGTDIQRLRGKGISLEDYQAMEETSYLLRSPANARHLLESIAELEAGKGVERDLIE